MCVPLRWRVDWPSLIPEAPPVVAVIRWRRLARGELLAAGEDIVDEVDARKRIYEETVLRIPVFYRKHAEPRRFHRRAVLHESIRK